MKIGVLMGGRSPEREISLKTGKNVIEGIKRLGYPVVGIDAKEDVLEKIKEEKVDLAFISLHGPLGEDGTIQGLLEFIGIPYTGSGVLSSSLCMDKIMSKKIMIANQIPTPEFCVLLSDWLETPQGLNKVKETLIESGLNLPLIVKPSVGGSTIGTAIIMKEEDFIPACKDAGQYWREILVERFIEGMEITVGVLGGDQPQALPVIEIIPEGGFYNFTTKYQPGMSTHIIPARIPEDLYNKAQHLAVLTFKALGCYGMGRVDFMVTEKELFTLELNTIPGMTETSLLPEAAQKEGISFEQLIQMQIDLALLRHERMKVFSGIRV